MDIIKSRKSWLSGIFHAKLLRNLYLRNRHVKTRLLGKYGPKTPLIEEDIMKKMILEISEKSFWDILKKHRLITFLVCILDMQASQLWHVRKARTKDFRSRLKAVYLTKSLVLFQETSTLKTDNKKLKSEIVSKISLKSSRSLHWNHHENQYSLLWQSFIAKSSDNTVESLYSKKIWSHS